MQVPHIIDHDMQIWTNFGAFQSSLVHQRPDLETWRFDGIYVKVCSGEKWKFFLEFHPLKWRSHVNFAKNWFTG